MTSSSQPDLYASESASGSLSHIPASASQENNSDPLQVYLFSNHQKLKLCHCHCVWDRNMVSLTAKTDLPNFFQNFVVYTNKRDLFTKSESGQKSTNSMILFFLKKGCENLVKSTRRKVPIQDQGNTTTFITLAHIMPKRVFRRVDFDHLAMKLSILLSVLISFMEKKHIIEKEDF